MLIEWSETTYIIAIEITCTENAHMSSLGVQEYLEIGKIIFSSSKSPIVKALLKGFINIMCQYRLCHFIKMVSCFQSFYCSYDDIHTF